MAIELSFDEREPLSILLDEIRHTRDASFLRERLFTLGKVFSQTWQRQNPGIVPYVVGIPRAGVPLSRGFQFGVNGAPLLMANTGLDAQKRQPIICPEIINQATNICLVDTVVFSGDTIRRILSALGNLTNGSRIHVITAFATPQGVRAIQNSTHNINVQFGLLEPRQKRIWRPYFYRFATVMEDMPDFGQLLAYGGQ